MVFPGAMPHALWEYQGEQVMQVTERMDPNTGDMIHTSRLVIERPGKLSRVEYDRYVGDLVNFLAYMSEPGATARKQWGILVLFFLAGFFILTLLLKKEFWKDVK
jgi:ubiquinol-cytochrome c reductase cytochrome c1 subunit